MKELEKAVFMLKVKMYKWHTFTAENMARMCGMSIFPLSGRDSRHTTAALLPNGSGVNGSGRIMEDMTYRPELTLKEVQSATISFPRATSTISVSRECSKDRVN